MKYLLIITLLLSTANISMANACTVGLTPGYWKNTRMHIDAWNDAGFAPTDLIVTSFPIVTGDSPFDSDTLLDALKYHGGPGIAGARRILMRAAVACLLSQYYFDQPQADKDYPVNQVALVWDGTRAEILALATELDGYNNLGPP